MIIIVNKILIIVDQNKIYNIVIKKIFSMFNFYNFNRFLGNGMFNVGFIDAKRGFLPLRLN